ncbi:hypothetical protein H0E87_028822, partial [Populus deltoides]
ALTLKTTLLSVQALLSAPEPDDPQDAVVAQQYLRDYQTFVGTARYWTETFAKTSSLGVEEKFIGFCFPRPSVSHLPRRSTMASAFFSFFFPHPFDTVVLPQRSTIALELSGGQLSVLSLRFWSTGCPLPRF